MPRNPEFVFAALSDMHIGGEWDEPQYYVPSKDIEFAIQDARSKHNFAGYLLGGDQVHKGLPENAYAFAKLIKSAGILYDVKLAINGNHELKHNGKYTEEVRKILEGEANVITMQDGQVYDLRVGSEVISVAAFSGYMGDLVDPWGDPKEAAKVYHPISMNRFDEFETMLDSLQNAQNVLLMHFPLPDGKSEIKDMYLSSAYTEAVKKRTNKIPVALYGHLHNQSETNPYSGIEMLDQTKLEIASLPFRREAQMPLITIVDFSKVLA